MFQNLSFDGDHAPSTNNTTANNTSYPPSSACSPSPAPVPPIPPPRTPTNDDIEAIIQMATSNTSRNTPDGRAGPPGPLRDTRTQLFVGNLPYRVRWQDLKDLFRKAGTVLRADVSLGPDNRSRGYGTVLLATAEDAGRAVDMYNGYDWQTRVLEVRPDRLPAGNRDYAGTDIPHDEFDYGQSAAQSGVQPSITTSSASIFPAHVQPPLLQARSVQSPSSHSYLHLHSRSISNSILEQAHLDNSIFDLEQRPGTSGTIAGRSHSGLGGVLASSRDGMNLGGFAMGLGGNPPNRTLFVGNLPFHVQWQDLKDLFRLSGPVLRADVALAADGRSRGFGTVVFRTEDEAERARRSFDGYDFNGRTLKVHFDKFSQSQASLGPYDMSFQPDSMARNTSLLDDYHMSTDFPRGYAEGIDFLQNKMISTPVSPMTQESAHVSPSPAHSRTFSSSNALPLPMGSYSQQQPFAFTHSQPRSQPYSPVHQHSFAASSSSSLAQSLTQSPLAQSMQSYPHPSAPRVSAAHQQRNIQTTSLSLPESLAPTSYPSPSPKSNSSLAEVIASVSGSSAGSLLDILPKSVSGMSGLSGSESESVLASLQERERRLAMERDTDQVAYEPLLRQQERLRAQLLAEYEQDKGFNNYDYADQSRSWDRRWGKRRGREGDLDWENSEDRGRGVSGRERSTSRRDETAGLDIDNLMQSLALTRGVEESAERGSGMLDKGDTLTSTQGNRASNYSASAAAKEGDRDSSVHSTARRPALVAGIGSGKASGTSTSSWSPASTTASRSVSGTGSSGGVSSTAASSFTTDQLSPQHVQSASAPYQDEGNTLSHEASPKSALGVNEEGMKRRATADAAVQKPDPPKMPHSRSQPEPTSLTKPSPDAAQPSSPPQTKTQHNAHRRPNVRSPRHTQSPTQTQQQAQQQHQHPHHPGPIVLPPPVTNFPLLPAPHTLSPHGMMMSMGMGSPLHHPGSPVYHLGANTTPTNANSSMGMAAATADLTANSSYGYGVSGSYPGHGLHPSVVPMTPHGLPPITPSMPPFTFLPQPSPIHHHHPDQNSSSIHYPHASVMSMGMGGMTLGHLPSPSQASFTPTTMGPSSPHHIVPTHIQQSYQHATHTAVHHHMMSSFSPGIAISPGSVYRPGGQGNSFINPAVGAPVHMHVHGGHPQAMHSPGAMSMYGYSAGSFSPGEIALGAEPGGYFDNVYQMPVYYGPIGPAPGLGGTSDSVEREIMKTREEGGSGGSNRECSGIGQEAGEGGAAQQELADSPDEVDDAEGGTKPSRTYSLSSKRPEGLAFLHRSDSDPSVKTPGAGPGSGAVTQQ